MCCCGCAIAVLEPGAGFGSWRALFGSGTGRQRRSSMKAKDVMTEHVITVAPDASIVEALQLMLQNKISGLPVVDKGGNLVGIVTEGDFLRRSETGTERRRPRWIEFILGPGTIAKDYVHSHARRIDEVMTAEVETVGQDVGLEDVAALMEKRRVKRVPVMRGGKLVGIVSRQSPARARNDLLRGRAGREERRDDPRHGARRARSPVLGAAAHDRRRRAQRCRRTVGHGDRSRPA
jgi:CBS domain-containing protein